jgi:hypothetical protein
MIPEHDNDSQMTTNKKFELKLVSKPGNEIYCHIRGFLKKDDKGHQEAQNSF